MGRRLGHGRASTACSALAAGVAIASTVAGGGLAQVVERNLPPVSASPPPTLPSAQAPLASDDARPLGPALHSLVLLGPTSAPVSGAPVGEVQSRDLAEVDLGRLRRVLRPFLGRPLSRRLISQVEAAIVREYRRQGRPFVAVSTPEQEISSGLLQVRVVQFRLATVTVKGAPPKEARRIESALRVESGQPIDAVTLEQDLDWLSRYPFRTLAPALSPGAASGETDLTLVATHQRPWRVFAGYANSGSAGTHYDRIFMGGEVGGLFNADSLFAVQVTGSPDFWAKDGRPFAEPHPAYESAAGRFTLPVAPRQEIEVSADAVQTQQPAQAFDVRQFTLEGSLGYRGALSNLVALPGDALVGVEVRRQTRDVFFGDVKVLNGAVDVFQVYAGWSVAWSDRLGHSSLALTAHVSPGGLSPGNADANFAGYTSGRVAKATYAYADIEYDHDVQLPAGLALTSELIGQYADRPLPDSEQFAIGGASLVRGYTLDDGAFDDGLVMRNTLHLPMPNPWRGCPLSVLPYVFADAGVGRDNNTTGHDAYAASVGFGADIQFRNAATASLIISRPLADAPSTRADAWRLQARVTATY